MPVPARPTGIALNGGIASAVGLGGLTVTREVGRCVRIELGVGYGFTGWQLSVMPQLTGDHGRGVHFFVMGVGLSISFPDQPYEVTGNPVWLNLDLIGYERRFASGLSLGFVLGATIGLGGGRLCASIEAGCGEEQFHDVRGVWSPQTRLKIGYWF